jgi:hypothetical protein
VSNDKWAATFHGGDEECEVDATEIPPMDPFTEGRRIMGVDFQFATDPDERAGDGS